MGLVWYFYFLCGISRPVSNSRLYINSLQDWAHLFCCTGKGFAAKHVVQRLSLFSMQLCTCSFPNRKRNCRWTYCAAAVSVVNEDFAHVFCRAGKGIAAEQQLEFHFWARLIFSMVVSWRILSTSINLQKNVRQCDQTQHIFHYTSWRSWNTLKQQIFSATSKFVQLPHGRGGGVKSNCTSV